VLDNRRYWIDRWYARFYPLFFAGHDIPGELHRFPFVNFSQARNEALDRARASKLDFDYLLLADADMELTVQNPEFSRDLTAAAYQVLQRSGVTYWNTRLLRRDGRAKYRGVTHEFLNIFAGDTKTLEGIIFIDHGLASSRADKYGVDIRLLVDAIATEQDRSMIARYTFYLANTYRDSGQKEAALEMYLKRAQLGHWQQEVFMSLLDAARLMETLPYSDDEVMAAYENAIAACPARAEALHGAARFCRNKRLHEQGYQFAARGLRITYPKNALFISDWIYEYGLLDEFAVNAYWTARYSECVDACDRLLNDAKLPANNRERVLKNQTFAADKLKQTLSSLKPSVIVQPTPAIPTRAGKTTEFGLFCYSYTGNLGDEIQSIAARNFLPTVDVYVDREQLNMFSAASDSKIKMIFNGWFLHKSENWPPSADIDPLLISFHLTNSPGLQGIGLRASEILLAEPVNRYLKHFGPVGARDLITLALLQNAGIESYFSGCLTLTLRRPDIDCEDDLIVLNDVPEAVSRHIKTITSKRIITTHHGHQAYPDQDRSQRYQEAERLLNTYAAASCVITTRLHCALPCLAFGTPVLLLETAPDRERFAGLIEHVRHSSVEQFISSAYPFDVNEPLENAGTFLPIQAELRRRVDKFIQSDPLPPFSWPIDDQYAAVTGRPFQDGETSPQ
jgi:hypothetical protein